MYRISSIGLCGLEVNEYTVNLQETMGLKLAVVADLHERQFEDIIEALKKIHPSLIILPGDTLERRDEGYKGMTKADIDKWQQTSFLWKIICKTLKKIGLDKKNDYYAHSSNGINFIRSVSLIAPIVMSVGNHEWYFTDNDYETFNECKVVLLDNSDIDININGRTLIFGGLSTKYDLIWLEKFVEKDGYKILLCHHPEYKYKFKNSDRVQLTISGHAHGGQIRVFGKGLFAPGQGIFPQYTKGLYGHHLVSAGVSNTAFIPRIFNPREICIINI